MFVTSKNLIPMCVKKILEDYSDIHHPLKQEDIIYYLKKDYRIEDVERKSIGRTIERLRDEFELDIESTRKGVYLNSRLFEEYELRLLIDSVLSSRFISNNYSSDIVEKLSSLSNIYFKSNAKYTLSLSEADATHNRQLFLTVDAISDAIEKKKKIEFDYNKYGLDKKLHKTSQHIVSPMNLIIHNQRYYLLSFSDKYQNIAYFRVDKITNVNILDENQVEVRNIEGYTEGFNQKKINNNLPYMFSDTPSTIVLKVKENSLDQMFDWLGYDIEVEQLSDGYCKIICNSSPMAIKYFALQYATEVEVLTPKNLRNEIKACLEETLKKYEG